MLYDEGFTVLKDRLDGELVVGASLIMSCFCYSIFRLDPYIGCQHSCSYCYTRFLPGYRRSFKAIANYARLLRAALEVWRSSGAPLSPFRLSALTDPFPPIEEKLGIALEVMKVARKLGIPLIVCTKSTLIAREPWLNIVKELAGEGLAIVQLSVAFLNDEVARKLEKGAPPPSERFKAAEKLADEQIPVVLRLQPLIPYLNSSAEFLEEYADAARSVGARHVILEVLRILRWRDLECFRVAMPKFDFVKLTNPALWEPYPWGAHKHPGKGWRRSIYELAIETLSRRGLTVGLCREGFFDLNAAPDCCGIYLLRERVVRVTLREQFYGFQSGYRYIQLEDVERLPLPAVKRKLRKHFQLVYEVLANKELLQKIIG
ncbi:MAG: radical SAM protein [Thermofilaceae archaeon]